MIQCQCASFPSAVIHTDPHILQRTSFGPRPRPYSSNYQLNALSYEQNNWALLRPDGTQVLVFHGEMWNENQNQQG